MRTERVVVGARRPCPAPRGCLRLRICGRVGRHPKSLPIPRSTISHVFKKRPTKTRKGRPKAPDRGPSADELILMRRFPEAEVALRALLKEQRDPQWRLKLADVLRELGRGDDAVTEYLHASDAFLEDGFTDRAHAAAMRARKLVPGRADIEARFQRLQHRKRLDFLQRGAVDALEKAASTDEGHVSMARIELEQIWNRLSDTDFVRVCEPHQLIRLLAQMKLKRVAEGKRLVAEGSTGGLAVLICRGELEARRITSKGSLALRTFGQGDFLGERSVLSRGAWQVSLVAPEAATVLTLDRAGFEATLVGNDNPRELIDFLRGQSQDQEVERLVNQLH